MRRVRFLLLAVLMSAAVPATVLAARAWTQAASPLTLTQGNPTAIQVTVHNTGDSGGGSEITCVRIQVPASFTITSVGIVSVYGQTSGAAFGAWHAVWPGADIVSFKEPTDKVPLIGSSPPKDVAVFRITGSASAAGTMSWSAEAADHPGGATSTACGSGALPPATITFGVNPGSGPTPTPSPTPTPAPTPVPTPVPTHTPTPTPPPTPTTAPGPTPRSTLSADPTSGPATAEPSSGLASPSPSSAPSTVPSLDPLGPSASPPGPVVSPGPSSGGNGSPGGRSGSAGIQMPGSDGSGTLPIGGMNGAVGAVLDSLPGGMAVWAYPAFVLSVPGLLLLVAIAAQALGALSWLPLVRRRLGAFGPRRALGGPR